MIDVLNVRTDIPIISQQLLENHLDSKSEYSVTVSDTPSRPEIELGGNQLLWLNQFVMRLKNDSEHMREQRQERVRRFSADNQYEKFNEVVREAVN